MQLLALPSIHPPVRVSTASLVCLLPSEDGHQHRANSSPLVSHHTKAHQGCKFWNFFYFNNLLWIYFLLTAIAITYIKLSVLRTRDHSEDNPPQQNEYLFWCLLSWPPLTYFALHLLLSQTNLLRCVPVLDPRAGRHRIAIRWQVLLFPKFAARRLQAALNTRRL
jgi:hypothetical protein